jgi:hypothetical protein
LIAASTPSPVWWAHDSACAWTAAWLTLRRRRFLGQRALLTRTEWSEQLRWRERDNAKRSSHRPDLVGWVGDDAIAIEVELAGKSRSRLDAILTLHSRWINVGKSGAVIYICGDEEGLHRVQRSARRVGPWGDGRLRLELLDTIKQQTVTTHDASRTSGAPPVEQTGGIRPVGRPAAHGDS